MSFNLAASLAQSGKRVILVDADLRHQVVKARFGITTPSAGLLELSRAAKPDIARVLIPVPGVANLSLLAGDTRMKSPIGILDSPKMRSLLERTRTLADYVIIDAPPAGLLADAAVLFRLLPSSAGSVIVPFTVFTALYSAPSIELLTVQ